jgi:signal transduction histidine kinase
MLFQFTISSAILFVVGILVLVFDIVIWSRRRSPGAVAFFAFLLSIIWWLFARTLQSAAVYFDDKVIWAIVSFIGIMSTVIFWLCFTLEYTNSTWWKRSLYLPLLFLVPFVSLLIAIFSLYSNPGLFSFTISADQTGFFVVWSHSLVFWIQVIYLMLIVVAGMVILGRFMMSRPGLSRRQFFIILIGTLIPTVSPLFYTFHGAPASQLDWLPLTFVIGGLIYAMTIFRFKFLDLVPAARRMLVDSLPDRILVLNREETIVDVNAAVRERGDQGAMTWLGRRLESVWPRLDGILRKLKDGEHTEMVLDGEEDKYVDISLKNIKGSRGEKVGQLIVLRDITEWKRTHKRLEESYQEEKRLRRTLEEEIEKRSKYTWALVHELNTPLTSILASSEMLEAEVEDKILQALVKNVRRSAQKLEERISELVDLAKGEAGMLKIRAMPLDIGELLREIVAEMRPGAEKKGLKMELELDEMPVAFVDRTRFRQVMVSLMNNAIKFTEKGGVKVKGTVYDSRNILVEVEDSGRGINEEVMEHLFDPYRRRMKEGDQLGGWGIGLALVKMFVDLHGGKVSVKSQPGKGTTFSLTMPVYETH